MLSQEESYDILEDVLDQYERPISGRGFMREFYDKHFMILFHIIAIVLTSCAVMLIDKGVLFPERIDFPFKTMSVLYGFMLIVNIRMGQVSSDLIQTSVRFTLLRGIPRHLYTLKVLNGLTSFYLLLGLLTSLYYVMGTENSPFVPGLFFVIALNTLFVCKSLWAFVQIVKISVGSE